MPSDMSYAQQLNAAHKARRSRMYAAAYVEPEPLDVEPEEPPLPPVGVMMVCVAALRIAIKEKLEAKKITRIEVRNAVLKASGLSLADFVGRKKTIKYYVPRYVFYWVCRSHLRVSFPMIGVTCGFRDHSTIQNGVNRVNASIAAGDDTYSGLIEAVEKLLGVVPETTKPTD
jgi:Bacterial dnaA protein helix-turn-helix